jgi:hypothetical protein
MFVVALSSGPKIATVPIGTSRVIPASRASPRTPRWRRPTRQVFLRDQVLVLLCDEQAGLLEGVDEGRVQPCRLHVLDHHGLQVFRVGQVGEEEVVRPRLPPMLGDELLGEPPQDLPHLRRDGRGPVNGALVVLDPLEARDSQQATKLSS